MKRSLVIVFAFAVPLLVDAAGFESVQLSEDKSRLTITTLDGRHFNAPRLAEQWVYDLPQVSPTGERVGWLVAYPNGGASYPLPTELVVLDSSNHLHTFSGSYGMLVRWCFSSSSRAVVFAYTFPHGTQAETFDIYRIADERLLARYEIPNEETAHVQARKHAPKWAQCLLK